MCFERALILSAQFSFPSKYKWQFFFVCSTFKDFFGVGLKHTDAIAPFNLLPSHCHAPPPLFSQREKTHRNLVLETHSRSLCKKILQMYRLKRGRLKSWDMLA